MHSNAHQQSSRSARNPYGTMKSLRVCTSSISDIDDVQMMHARNVMALKAMSCASRELTSCQFTAIVNDNRLLNRCLCMCFSTRGTTSNLACSSLGTICCINDSTSCLRHRGPLQNFRVRGLFWKCVEAVVAKQPRATSN